MQATDLGTTTRLKTPGGKAHNRGVRGDCHTGKRMSKLEECEANLAAVEADLAAARDAGDSERASVLQALVGSGGSLLVYEPEQHHHAVLFGDLATAHHVAIVVPGVGDEANLRDDWLPAATNLFKAAGNAAVILWKGYDNPSDLLRATVTSAECDEGVMAAGSELAEFVRSLPLRAEQTLTIVAHSFGSIVTGSALADHDLHCTDVVVAGSPGMTVDGLRQLHLQESHFFSEEAPGDTVAELGIFGAAPTSPKFGGTRMRTNAPGHVEVMAHSSYFVPGSEALENIVDVVTGRYSGVLARRPTLPETVGGFVAWTIRLPTVPVRVVGRRYRGPGFRLLIDSVRLVDLGAAQTGNLVRGALDESETAIRWVGRRGWPGRRNSSRRQRGSASRSARPRRGRDRRA